MSKKLKVIISIFAFGIIWYLWGSNFYVAISNNDKVDYPMIASILISFVFSVMTFAFVGMICLLDEL